MAAWLALALYAPLLAAAGVAVWRRPVLALYAFVVGLAAHNAVMALLYGVGVRGGALTALQAWKEALLAVALARIATDAWRARRLPFAPGVLDALALAFGAFVVVYAVIPQDVLGGHAGSKAVSLGFRHDLIPVAAFFLGRSLRLERAELRRLLWTIAGTAATVAAVGLVEEYTVSLDWWAHHGAVGYFNDQLGYDYHGPRRLPENFVFNSGNEQELARRLVSTFLSPLGASYLFVVGFVAVAAVPMRRSIAVVLALFAGVGLLFTHTRTSVAALALGLVLLAVLARSVWPVIAAVVVVAAALAFTPVFPDLAPGAHWTKQELLEQRRNAREHGGVGGTLTGGEPSIHSHLTSLREGIRTVIHHPQGFGLGNAGQTASRTNTPIKAGESTYTELGVEVGLAGALVFIAWWLGLLGALVRVALRRRDAITAALAASVAAVLAIGIQTDVIGVPWLAYCLPALAATALRLVPVGDTEAEPASRLLPWPRRSIPA